MELSRIMDNLIRGLYKKTLEKGEINYEGRLAVPLNYFTNQTIKKINQEYSNDIGYRIAT